METRSKRRQNQSLRPPYPQLAPQSAPSSPSHSTFQSSSSLSSVSSINTSVAAAGTQQSPNMLYPQQTQQGFASAPLPSPSGTQPPSYFGSFAQPSQMSYQTQQQQQRIPNGQTVAGAYLGQRGDGNGAPETAPYLKDFNLVAEAAKRAQMACLTRDLGDCGL